ncbi:1-deoxy-D-xylulose-5-phosphate synthase [Shewanella xiamenensis]|uniref:1-deoxy-D-xylulose-5-phosphate synthase n=1 Tax=Shewanella xiamenensis TaxID=332186 RepID=UPI001CC7CE7F|nr:1-deoxy-D-xylulose-5-phosphate synthase [Shewanella xiamenensis]MCT8857930.1 1-deoxy-D-xylulose-5-phosphate synthase [Shewanella xiamenensis]UWG63543.1 1-deoxy-D-xylulose-5-phosphate synthase [Shewanella xiamenensis]BDA59842.1 1-deoxy-D-xylulose-5-phosphate synthase [Shewanella xiamenensis]
MAVNDELKFINSTIELKNLPIKTLDIEADKIRRFLIDKISTTGGHIGANLSVIELTIAIHYVFDSPVDKIIFDTGHQGYTHKLITGRRKKFESLNTYNGMSRFIAREESEHDIIDASHAGTSISLATGIAAALKTKKSDHYTVVIIGDGSLVEGMAFEALNFGSVDKNSKLVIVVNDNEMAIAPSIGGLRQLTTGVDWHKKSQHFFESLGYNYIGVQNGHCSEDVVLALTHAKSLGQPTVVHVKTEKGKGLACAATHPYKMHFSMPFDAVSGLGASPTVSGKTFAVVLAEKLAELMTLDTKINVITPATPYASSLDYLSIQFPDRVIDVGMAEQHAVGMACGMALEGLKPVVCMQTTFMQRAFDQLLHDACYMNLPITVLGVRAGFAGYDGSTHHGVYDIPYLKSFPNMQLEYPINSAEAKRLLEKRLENPMGPMVILHPYEPLIIPEPLSGVLQRGLSVAAMGEDGFVICLGNTLAKAWELKSRLAKLGRTFGIICVQTIKPFPSNEILELLVSGMDIITLEESILAGGFGSLLLESFSDSDVNFRVFRSGIIDRFIRPGSKQECSDEAGITAQQIIMQIQQRWTEYQEDK